MTEPVVDPIARTIELSTNFNKAVATLLRQFEAKTRTDADLAVVEKIRRKLQVLKYNAGQEAPLINAADEMVKFTDIIITADIEARDKFFLTEPVTAPRNPDGSPVNAEETTFITDLVATVRKHYQAASRVDREKAVDELKAMLDYSLEYLLVKG